MLPLGVYGHTAMRVRRDVVPARHALAGQHPAVQRSWAAAQQSSCRVVPSATALMDSPRRRARCGGARARNVVFPGWAEPGGCATAMELLRLQPAGTFAGGELRTSRSRVQCCTRGFVSPDDATPLLTLASERSAIFSTGISSFGASMLVWRVQTPLWHALLWRCSPTSARAFLVVAAFSVA
jgi:hypothetical protein